MIEFKIAIMMVCGILFSLGGYHWLFCRRFIMPSLLALTFGFLTHSYLCGVYVLPVIGTLCLGYFGSRFWGRGLWLGLQAIVIGVGVTISGHLSWWIYLPYCLGAVVLAGSLYDLEQIIGDLIFGCWLATMIFLLH